VVRQPQTTQWRRSHVIADWLARWVFMEHFRTGRLIARDWTAEDAQAAFDIYGRDEVMRWLGAQPRQPVPSLGQMRERLDAMIERSRDEPDYGLWAVELRTGLAAGTVVGAVLLSRLPGPAGEVEIGWHLNPEYWGNGYATEAGGGAVGLAFGLSRVGPDAVEPGGAAGRSPLDRVIALVDPDNARSQAVCRRLGMRHLGQTDEFYGLVLELFELGRAEVEGPA
jgi:RimJ/RimL family protein N-acetyltransferase